MLTEEMEYDFIELDDVKELDSLDEKRAQIFKRLGAAGMRDTTRLQDLIRMSIHSRREMRAMWALGLVN